MTKGRFAFVVVVALASVALSLSIIPAIVPHFLGVDFAVFARALTWTPAELYSDTGSMPFLYPPTAILPFKLVGLIPYWSFAVLSAIALFTAVSTVCDKKVAALSLLSKAAFKGLQLGQIPMLLAAGLFAALRLNPFAGGLVWGLVATIKPQLMIFAPVALLVRRDWRMLSGMMAGAGVSFAASLMDVGFAPWFAWQEAVATFADTRLMEGAVSKALTPAGIAVANGFAPLPFIFLGGLIGALAVVLSARYLRGAELIALIVAASLAISPYGYAHDTIAIIPACVILMLRGRWAYAIPSALLFIGTPTLALTGLMCLLSLFALDGLRRSQGKDN